jgi:hypothetical protein
MQSVSPVATEPEVIRVFPACPASWDASFTLLARAGFRVTSMRKNGVIPFVEIESRLGGVCQLRNPWNAPCFLAEEGKRKQPQSGDILRFKTKAGKRYQLFPKDLPAPIRISPAIGPSPVLKFTMENGTEITERLGRDSG